MIHRLDIENAKYKYIDMPHLNSSMTEQVKVDLELSFIGKLTDKQQLSKTYTWKSDRTIMIKIKKNAFVRESSILCNIFCIIDEIDGGGLIFIFILCKEKRIEGTLKTQVSNPFLSHLA